MTMITRTPRTRHLPSRWYTWSTRVSRLAKHTGLAEKRKHRRAAKDIVGETPLLYPEPPNSFCALLSLLSLRLFSNSEIFLFSILLFLSFSLFNARGIRRISWQSRESLASHFPALPFRKSSRASSRSIWARAVWKHVDDRAIEAFNFSKETSCDMPRIFFLFHLYFFLAKRVRDVRRILSELSCTRNIAKSCD